MLKSIFKLKVLLVIAGLALFVSSCRRDTNKHNSWDIDLLAPLMSGELSINNIVPDTLLHTNSDKSISLIYKTRLFGLNLSELVMHIPDTTFSNPMNIGTIGLASKQLHYYYSLGRMASASGNPQLQLIVFLNGTSQVVPAISGIASQPTSLNASNLFTRAWIKNGLMQINGDNDLPVDLDSVTFMFKNNDQFHNVVGSLTIPHIPAHSHFIDTIYLAGKVVEGVLEAQLLNMKTPGSNGNPVLIDTSKGLQVTMVLYHVTCDSAIAVFPSQSLIDTAQLVTYNYVSGGAEVDFVKIKSGDIRVQVFSSLPDSIHFRYKMPCALSPFGEKVDMGATVKPAPRGGFSTISRTVDLAGYTIDFTGPNHNMHNTFYDTVLVGIDSTGRSDTLRATDSLYLFYTLENIVPEYARGYLGDTSVNISVSNVPFTILNKVISGNFNPEKIKVDMTIANGIGIDGQAKINSLTATNSKTSSTLALTAPVIGNNVHVPRATDHPLTPSITTQTIDENNSNIKQLIQLKPDQLSMNGQVRINPSGNALYYKDFVYYNSNLDVDMRTEMPLSFIANGLQIRDTLDFSLGSPAKTDRIKDGVLTIYLMNGFPLSAQITLSVYDENWNKIDDLLLNSTIASAGLGANCVVTSPVETKIELNVNQTRMTNLKRVKHAIVNAVLNTSQQSTCNGQYLKIYDNYLIKTNITAKFNYNVSAF